jgi:two-component system response regulator HydG
MAKILVADDEPKLGNVVTQMLQLDRHEVLRVGGGQEALAAMASGKFDVVVTDLRMPGTDGLAVLRAARGMAPAPEVIVMTAYGSAESAVEAMKAGAADYLTKPRRGVRRRGASASSSDSRPTWSRRVQA